MSKIYTVHSEIRIEDGVSQDTWTYVGSVSSDVDEANFTVDGLRMMDEVLMKIQSHRIAEVIAQEDEPVVVVPSGTKAVDGPKPGTRQSS